VTWNEPNEDGYKGRRWWVNFFLKWIKGNYAYTCVGMLELQNNPYDG